MNTGDGIKPALMLLPPLPRRARRAILLGGEQVFLTVMPSLEQPPHRRSSPNAARQLGHTPAGQVGFSASRASSQSAGGQYPRR